MISSCSIISLCIEYKLPLAIWELRFEFLVCDGFLLSLFHMFRRILDFGSKGNLRIEIWDWFSPISTRRMQVFRINGPMEFKLSLTFWELRFEFLVDNILPLNLFPMYWRIYVIPNNLRIEIWYLSKWYLSA